ncbi:polysaccharide biosynthesis C-terminal domain-containing protein [[Eubacterium] hominis]|uniref:oligosaccharide flippase family protein n=1 Tax=[Eubacterium] hominis TaxID=2764325 RepID=UPI003A4D426D
MQDHDDIQSVANGKTLSIYSKTIVFKLICVVIGFVNSILINRCLGVALRGEYTTILNWASLLQLFLNLGIGTTYPAFKRKYPDECKPIFTTIIALMAVIYLMIIFFLFPSLDSSYRFIAILALITTIESLLIFIAIVEDVSKRNLINIVTSVLHTIVLGVIFIFLKFKLSAILGAVIIDHLVFCTTLIVLFQISKIRIHLINRKIIKEIMIIAIPAMLMNMLMYLNYHADVLFLSYITKDNYAVGLYGTAITLGNMLWIIPDAFKDILFNRAAKKDNPEEVIVSIICNFLICIVVLIGFLFLGKWFLGIMYGSDFIAAYPLVLMLFIGTLPMVLYKLIHPIYIANGKTKTVVLLLSIAVASNFIGNIIIIPYLGAMGAAIASVISYSICGIAFFIKFCKDFKINFKATLIKVFKLIKRIFDK